MPLPLQLPSSLLFALYGLLLTPPTYALFQLNYPPARGYDPTTLPSFPCGGFNTPNASTNRTLFPIEGGPIQLTMDQQRADVQVLLGLGNDVGVGFDVVIVGIFEELGMGGFCVGGVVSGSLGIRLGMGSGQWRYRG